MKVNPVFLLISLAIAALAGYGFFSWNSGEAFQLLIAIGAGIMVFITISGTIAIQSAGGRGSVGNIRALSIVFLIIFIISNVIFSFITLITPTAYIVINGILFLIYILIAYAVSRALRN
jgi:hypothetical protein